MEEVADLPEECWEQVLERMTLPSQWQAVSLASRKFLRMTNRVRSSITISNSCASLPGGLTRILRRFSGLKDIDLSNFNGNLGRPLLAIAKARIPLRSLTLQGQRGLPVQAVLALGQACPSLRVLNCSRFLVWQDSDLEAVAEAFPFLEKLDVSYPQHGFRPPRWTSVPDPSLCPALLTDSGIESMASALSHLKSVNFSGHHMVSDVSLEALALKCKDLEELFASDCPFVSDHGLQQIAMFCERLKSLGIGGTRVTPAGINIAIGLSRSLSCLNLAHLVLNDEVLFELAVSHLPLRKLVLAGCKGVTSAGLLRLVCGCSGLHHLDLEGAHYLSDEHIEKLALNIQHVSFLSLNYCSMLTDSSFFCVLQSCKHLRELRMESTGLGWSVTSGLCSPTCRLHLQKLQLAWNKPVSDSILKQISKLCPFLLSLDISYCLLVTDRGIATLCRGCIQLRELVLKGCKKVHGLGVSKDEYLSIELLELESSGFDDAGLVAVSKSCPNLMSLGLEGCGKVTDGGLKKVTEGCKGLKMMNLKECQGINLDALAWMVFCCPSLRKLALPSSGITEGQRARLTRHGCELSRCMTC